VAFFFTLSATHGGSRNVSSPRTWKHCSLTSKRVVESDFILSESKLFTLFVCFLNFVRKLEIKFLDKSGGREQICSDTSDGNSPASQATRLLI